MSPTLEKARELIEQLSEPERCELTAYLNLRMDPDVDGEDDAAAAAWDEEISTRAASVVSGTAELIPGDEFHAQMAQYIADVKAGRNPAEL